MKLTIESILEHVRKVEEYDTVYLFHDEQDKALAIRKTLQGMSPRALENKPFMDSFDEHMFVDSTVEKGKMLAIKGEIAKTYREFRKKEPH